MYCIRFMLLKYVGTVCVTVVSLLYSLYYILFDGKKDLLMMVIFVFLKNGFFVVYVVFLCVVCVEIMLGLLSYIFTI